MNVDKYNEWIQLVAELTVNSLNSWQWASNSVYYLLGLWSRLVSSMPYLKGESPSLLETYVPKITEAYLTSRSVLPPSSMLASPSAQRKDVRLCIRPSFPCTQHHGTFQKKECLHLNPAFPCMHHQALQTKKHAPACIVSFHAYITKFSVSKLYAYAVRYVQGVATVRRGQHVQAGVSAGGAGKWHC